jgi:hypothetical protein
VSMCNIWDAQGNKLLLPQGSIGTSLSDC